jgi:D-alanyl-D-alanine carboxypeptidase
MEALRRRQRLLRRGRWGANPALVRIAGLAGVLALAAALGLGAVVAPSPVNALGPLPPCRYDDILTTPRGYGDWSITQVDTILRVTKGYVPPDLVSVSEAGIPGTGQVRALMIDDLREMTEAAKAADAAIGIQSAYRSFATQQVVFANAVAQHGRARALQLSARPGHSEHQLGLGIDFRSHPGGSPFNGTTWASTPAGKWMKAHAWEYGFVMSYPRGKIDVTCYDFEPWHYRYVGRELAAQIRASGLTQREYLWANFTTTVVPDVTPGPIATARPSRSPRTSPAAPASPGVTTSPPSTPPGAPPPTDPPPTASASPQGSRPPTAMPPPSPATTPPGAEPGQVAGEGPGLIAALAVALFGGISMGWMVLRRKPFRVGL